MNTPDDLQKLWQDQEAAREDSAMWNALIEEKRSGWNELVRAEDQAFYLIALCLVPLTAWAAWKAKYPWVHAGYGLMAATLALSVIGTFITSRVRPGARDSNLRQHLEALLSSYEQRTRLIRHGGVVAMAGLTVGLGAVILGIPGNASSPRAWLIAILSVAAANLLQWLSYKQWAGKVARKRTDAERLLKSLVADEHDHR
jgi:hypothetical protein